MKFLLIILAAVTLTSCLATSEMVNARLDEFADRVDATIETELQRIEEGQQSSEEAMANVTKDITAGIKDAVAGVAADGKAAFESVKAGAIETGLQVLSALLLGGAGIAGRKRIVAGVKAIGSKPEAPSA